MARGTRQWNDINYNVRTAANIEKIFDTEITESFPIGSHRNVAGVKICRPACRRCRHRRRRCGNERQYHSGILCRKTTGPSCNTRYRNGFFQVCSTVSRFSEHPIAEHCRKRIAIVDFDVHHGNGTAAISSRMKYAAIPVRTKRASIRTPDRRMKNIPQRLSNALLLPGSGSADFRAVWQQKFLPELDRLSTGNHPDQPDRCPSLPTRLRI